MSNVTDVLVIAKSNGSYAAKLTFESGQSRWINDGGIDNRKRVVIAEDRGHTVKVELNPEQVQAFKADAGNGEENAHHRIVGRGNVDGTRFVAFFDRTGTRLSLKPAADDAEQAETVSIADQFSA
jgi:hypothetical protein